MINLRYHIVSLVAVFLALGMGIVMGSTVIDRVTVDALNNKLDDVRKSTNAIRDDNTRLKSQIQQGKDFAETTRDELLRGHLKGVPVIVVAVAGIDRKPVDDLRAALVSAQATLEGTVWFTSKMRLAGDNDARALADSLQLAVDRPDVVRSQALTRLLVPRDPTAAEPSPLASLSAAGFVTYDPPPAPTTTSTSAVPPTLASLPLAGTRYVVVSGAGAVVSDDLVAVPFVQAASQPSAATGSGSQPSTSSGTPSSASSGGGTQPSGRVVAVEAGQDTQGGRAVFVGLLRGDPVVTTRVSTVDNLESAMGQTATILALEELALPRFGHYGVGPGAQRILPAPAA